MTASPLANQNDSQAANEYSTHAASQGKEEESGLDDVAAEVTLKPADKQ